MKDHYLLTPVNYTTDEYDNSVPQYFGVHLTDDFVHFLTDKLFDALIALKEFDANFIDFTLYNDQYSWFWSEEELQTMDNSGTGGGRFNAADFVDTEGDIHDILESTHMQIWSNGALIFVSQTDGGTEIETESLFLKDIDHAMTLCHDPMPCYIFPDWSYDV